MAPTMQLQSGQLLAGRWMIEQLAAVGGMGAVYRAFDVQTLRRVAIKVSSSPGETQVRHTVREGPLLARFAHPAIVGFVGTGRTPYGVPFLAMEWLWGQDLAQRLMERPLGVAECVVLARRLLEGVAAIHGKRLLHRDLKPSNLYLVNNDPGLVKILDLGIASPLRQARRVPAAVLGTQGYISPEQLRGKRADVRSDLYSVGCVLFECLVGRALHTNLGLLRLVAGGSLQNASADLCPSIEQLVRRLLAEYPDDRPQDAASALQELEVCARDARPASAALHPAPEQLATVVLGGAVGLEQATMTSDAALARWQAAETLAGQHRGRLFHLPGGWFVMVFPIEQGDDRARLARAALTYAKAVSAFAQSAIASGSLRFVGGTVDGPVLAQAAAALQEEPDPRAGVRADALTLAALHS